MSSKRTYNKPPLTVAEQVQLLIDRGMTVPDCARAEEFLSFVNYYRLSAYTFYFEKPSSDGTRSHVFPASVSFDMIVDLYKFDTSLRLLCIDALEQIEIAFKTAICLHLSLKYGSHWYEDPTLFHDVTEHTKFLASVDRDLDKKRGNEAFVDHYFHTYDTPQRPPSWFVTEILSLGTVSRLYANLARSKDKKAIARRFEVPAPVLESWMHSMTTLRNFCAHHSRIWNRKFPFSPAVPRKKKGEFREGNQLYHFVQVIRHLLAMQNVHAEWLGQLKEKLRTRPQQNLLAMGFQNDWENEPLWNR